MSQFDVFARRTGPGFLLDCQSAMLSHLGTRFVVPLLPRQSVPSIVSLLNPVFDIDAQQVVLYPQNAATVSVRELGQSVTSLEPSRYAIMNALDMLLSGF